jgi:2-oxoglutarate dehydrogenase E2 component (dihydrolipoamide succinyltransferase)
VAEADGKLEIVVQEEETVAIGTLVGTIDTDAAPEIVETPTPRIEAPSAIPEPPVIAPEPVTSSPENIPSPTPPVPMRPTSSPETDRIPLSPSVRRLVAEQKIDVSSITGTGPGGRITKGDVLLSMERQTVSANIPPAPFKGGVEEQVTRKAMSPIRKRIAARLLESKHNTAMLTTFNEIDMSRVMAIRAEYKEMFQKKYGVSLGFMSFFVKACVEALQEISEINAFIDDQEIVYHHYYHIGVAIGSDRGLVVPVIRHADQLGFVGIEQAIVDYVEKIKANRLELSDLEGGTFTISNGGVFGSLLSTPILNMPQSGILGMHKIEKRPVVVDDEIVIRPMMYVALSYDHRIVDGRESVTFLKRVKECIENPERMLIEV